MNVVCSGRMCQFHLIDLIEALLDNERLNDDEVAVALMLSSNRKIAMNRL